MFGVPCLLSISGLASIMAPKSKGLPKQVQEEIAQLRKAGEEVVDVMEEEGAQSSSPKPTESPVRKVNNKKKRAPVEATSRLTETVLKPKKAGVQKKKRNATLVLLEQLVAKLGLLGANPPQVPVPVERPPPANTNVRVPTPTAFTGKRGSFQFFASKVESYSLITNIARDKWVAVALQCMEEKPTKVWGTYIKRKEREVKEGTFVPTWEEFKEFMSKRYDSTDQVAVSRQKLDNVYQGQDTVEKYIERFVTLLGDVETEWEISENDKIHMFLKGLNTNLRLACTVNPQTGEKFADLDSLCTFVVKYESNLKVGGMMRQEKKALGAVRTPPQHGRVPPVQTPVPRSPFFGPVAGGGKLDSRTHIPLDRQCFFCKQFGHEQWACRAKQEYLARKGRHALPPPPPFPPRPQWKDSGKDSKTKGKK